ncbi:hypothetical protein CYLTODRAFT_393129 [Cylindrobasidium torrendii FP15055 ss-10]|uniref:INO80 complex subunit F domain-containing protein n=1 Tax=Cylindrobasidium torrendii FP15055 ss-10 TaxID=1314674 RepID=A0A0D7BI16_9AGAR|nr:hypothetical protein CYLTODRAFT_393129 [Cylindrobasidium torrendii FP15055 ss-10]
MSRQPSPGPLSTQVPYQMAKHTLPKPKGSAGVGLAQTSEDAKYQQKYKELQRKVKDVELDNDTLQYKVMQAKRGIQRMKLERALLYERLARLPTSPQLERQPLPSASAMQPQYHAPPMDTDTGYGDHARGHPGARAPDPGPSDMYRPLPRRNDPSMPPPNDPGRHHSRSHSRSHVSPPHQHSLPAQVNAPYGNSRGPPKNLYDMPLSQDRLDRGRRPDVHELQGGGYQSQISPQTMDSRSSSSRTHDRQRLGPGTYMNRDSRDPELEREWELHERERRDHSRGRDPASHLSPVTRHRQQQPRHMNEMGGGYADHRSRDDFYRDVPGPAGALGGGPGYPGPLQHSRSETPGSGSGSNGLAGPDGASRPESRDQAYYNDQPRSSTSSFRLRPISGPPPAQEDAEFGHDDGRSALAGGAYPAPSVSSARMDSAARKRREPDVMDVDDPQGPGMAYPSKRYGGDRPRGRDELIDERHAP